MKICAYVQTRNAKEAYKKESYDVRINAGLAVVIDILKHSKYKVEFASSATVHNYDVVLVSITSDCDWWTFLAERVKWQSGNYKVVVGGAGVLNVRPFLEYVDYFVLGRAEGVIDLLIASIDGFEHPSVVNSATFNVDRQYKINQVDVPYCHTLTLENGRQYTEGRVGCNHRCLFCGYTWHRRNSGGEFESADMWTQNKYSEIVMLDMLKGKQVDLNRLRMTAIDGMSERLRYMVNKPISNNALIEFVRRLATIEKPHRVKFYNILGYPTETQEEWSEFLDCLRLADKGLEKREKQACVFLHSTPFRAMPATPMALMPMSYKNFRGEVGKTLGRGLKNNIIFQGNSLWATDSGMTESLASVFLSAIAIRATESDIDNVQRVATSKKFWAASAPIKVSTLEKYFDASRLFGGFTWETLPTRYLRTYATLERKQDGWFDGEALNG